MARISQDLRYAIRMMGRAPGFNALIVLMLGIGMGVNLATFSVADAILLRMLPVQDPSSLFRTAHANGNAYDSGGGASYHLFQEMQKRTRRLADLFAYRPAAPALISIGGSEPGRLMQQTVSGNYFHVLGVPAAAGRMISIEDARAPEKGAVAVISYRLWKDRFDKSDRAIGSKLEFDRHVFSIIGIAPAQFFGVEVGRMVDVWTPLAMAPPAALANDHSFWLRVMGRRHPGVTIAEATAPMQAVMNEAMLEDVRLHAPPGTPKQVIDRFLAGMRIKGVPAGSGISYLRAEYKQPLEILMFVAGLVLLVTCSNVANLLIAKGSAREQEIAIRFSLGAGKGRIVQQLVTESFLLGIVSAGTGLLFAHWTAPILVRLLAPSTHPAKLAIEIDPRLLAFTGMLTFFTVILCGLLPAVRLAGPRRHAGLAIRARLAQSGRRSLTKFLVISQVALSLMLVIGALLFTRTLTNLLSSYLGFKPGSVLVAQIAFQHPGHETGLLSQWRDLLRRVRALPRVDEASLSSEGLFTGELPLIGIRTTATKALPVDPTTGDLFISTGYFESLGIKLLDGRDFELHDNDPSSPASVIVNEAFAHKFFGNQNPLGQKLTKLANAPLWAEIVGIVQNAKFASLRESLPPIVYIPYGRITEWIPAQGRPGVSMVLQVRGQQSAASLGADLRGELGDRFTIGEITRQQQLVDDTLVRERLLVSIAGVFGALAFLLVGLGLYGMMSYAVVQRKRELGIRMALGATRAKILGVMLRESATIMAAGIGLGILAAVCTTRLAKAVLFGVAPNDPPTVIISCLLLLVAGMAAAFVPAYRAARTEPMMTLRHE